jgi:nitroimidazol reductase NimA-like FMN-containing flavoprotein (pyridoxamine 5'-phosphate oxidase superfamily)
MRNFDPAAPFRVLARAECAQLLSETDMGRVAFANGAYPMILPVNYGVVDDLVVFKTGVGTKLANIPMKRVAFEVDGRGDGIAWSVVVLGHAREVTTALGARYDALRAAEIPILAPGAKVHWIAIEIIEISGREFSVETPA